MNGDDPERRDGEASSSDLLVVSPHRVGDRAVLEIAGELDLDTRTLLVTTAQSILENPPRPAGLDIDATRIEFMDSSGLATLLHIREQASLADVPFRVTQTSSQFRRVVDLAGLNKYLSAVT
jgi:anti-sigma B factor antagonist